MFHFPQNRDEWIVAIVAALVGFFFGGAAVALSTAIMQDALNIAEGRR